MPYATCLWGSDVRMETIYFVSMNWFSSFDWWTNISHRKLVRSDICSGFIDFFIGIWLKVYTVQCYRPVFRHLKTITVLSLCNTMKITKSWLRRFNWMIPRITIFEMWVKKWADEVLFQWIENYFEIEENENTYRIIFPFRLLHTNPQLMFLPVSVCSFLYFDQLTPTPKRERNAKK